MGQYHPRTFAQRTLGNSDIFVPFSFPEEKERGRKNIRESRSVNFQSSPVKGSFGVSALGTLWVSAAGSAIRCDAVFRGWDCNICDNFTPGEGELRLLGFFTPKPFSLFIINQRFYGCPKDEVVFSDIFARITFCEIFNPGNEMLFTGYFTV